MTGEEIVSRLLYRDGLMLVIDKPAGFAVHKGPKGGESLEDYFDALRFGLPRAPALAHRLDRDTSGCLVLGRHRKALATLARLFKVGLIGKTYWAVVEDGPGTDEGCIELPLARRDAARGWWMKPDPRGQQAHQAAVCANAQPTIYASNCRPSCPTIVTSTIAPGSIAALSRTGVKCSVRPLLVVSANRLRRAPTSRSRCRTNAMAPFSRSRRARSLMISRASCGMRAAGVPARAENG